MSGGKIMRAEWLHYLLYINNGAILMSDEGQLKRGMENTDARVIINHGGSPAGILQPVSARWDQFTAL